MPKITNIETNHSFDIDNETFILDGALDNNLNFPYGCTNGICGRCKAELIEGEFYYPDGKPDGIDETEKDNFILTCKCFAKTDIKLKVEEIKPTIVVKKLKAEVVEIAKLNHDVLKIVLDTKFSLAFLSGQYIDIAYKDFSFRSFSIANKSGSNLLELHIRIIETGEFTQFLSKELKVGDVIDVIGPKGDFYFRNSDKDILLVAGGTGLAPIKSILEELQTKNITNKIIFYWGVRSKEDLYLNFDSLNFSCMNINFIPVLSEPNSSWSGRSGFVHQAVIEDIADFSNYEVYACGSPLMVKAVANEFVNHGMAKDSFYSDSFDFNTRINK